MDKSTIEKKGTASEENATKTDRPKYNKTWQALMDNPINMVVYDKTLFYR